VLVVVGGSRRQDDVDQNEELDIEFSIDELELLEEQIAGLEFEDLEGLDTNSTLSLSSMDLDSLEQALQDLSFEDLEGLTEN
jgi:hypothetical protein